MEAPAQMTNVAESHRGLILENMLRETHGALIDEVDELQPSRADARRPGSIWEYSIPSFSTKWPRRLRRRNRCLGCVAVASSILTGAWSEHRPQKNSPREFKPQHWMNSTAEGAPHELPSAVKEDADQCRNWSEGSTRREHR
jgi:hypothetical protein